jgi:hypothetical protein
MINASSIETVPASSLVTPTDLPRCELLGRHFYIPHHYALDCTVGEGPTVSPLIRQQLMVTINKQPIRWQRVVVTKLPQDVPTYQNTDVSGISIIFDSDSGWCIDRFSIPQRVADIEVIYSGDARPQFSPRCEIGSNSIIVTLSPNENKLPLFPFRVSLPRGSASGAKFWDILTKAVCESMGNYRGLDLVARCRVRLISLSDEVSLRRIVTVGYQDLLSATDADSAVDSAAFVLLRSLGLVSIEGPMQVVATPTERIYIYPPRNWPGHAYVFAFDLSGKIAWTGSIGVSGTSSMETAAVALRQIICGK